MIVDDSPDFLVDNHDTKVVVVNLIDVVVDDVVSEDVSDGVESYDVDDDSALVVVDELFKGDADGDNDGDNDAIVDDVVDYVKWLVLQEDDEDDDGEFDHWCKAKFRARADEVVIVEDAMKEVMARDVSENVNVDVEVDEEVVVE